MADQQSKFTASSARRSELVTDGMSAMSSDMQPLHEAAATSAAAELALEMYGDSARKRVAGILTAHVPEILREAQAIVDTALAQP